MVRAVLDGRKSQTRRVIKIQSENKDFAGGWQFTFSNKHPYKYASLEAIECDIESYCPYGQPGDRLWAKETFQIHKWPSIFSSGSKIAKDPFSEDVVIYYKEAVEKQGEQFTNWKPSVHMPRWASRITLEITNVRVERVQDMKHEDFLTEGMNPCPKGHEPTECTCTMNQFQYLWHDLYSKKGYGWDKNPWVWVLEFKRITS